MAVTLRPPYFIPFLMTNKLLLILVIRVLNQLGSVSVNLTPLQILNILLNPSKNSHRTFKKNLILCSQKIGNIQSLSLLKQTQVLVTENLHINHHLETTVRMLMRSLSRSPRMNLSLALLN